MAMTTTTFHIVGDAFVDLFCFLNDSSSLPEAGGDARLDQPVKAYAGGSGLNTATHLQSLSRRRRRRRSDNGGGSSGTAAATALHHDRREIMLHTCLNPNDQYGQLLEKHAQEHGFPLLNCHRRRHHQQLSCSSSSSSHSTNGGCHSTNGSNTMNTNGNSNTASDLVSSSTGHCIIIVAGGERSFMTHVGCLGHFKATDLDINRILLDQYHHHNRKGGAAMHIHIAGYFNISGFHDGNLTAQLESIRTSRQQQQQQPTVVSLVAQHDATQQWDGGLEGVVPLLDFLILNELEASHIVTSGRKRQKEQQGARSELLNSTIDIMMNGSSSAAVAATDSAATPRTAATLLRHPHEWISYFGTLSNDCVVVVTRGSQGAMAFYQNQIIAMVEPAVPVPVLVDPTGAGDAFAAGFLHGIWDHYWRQNEEQQQDQRHQGGSKNAQRVAWSAEAIHHGLMWGCATGTATVTIRGASIPPQHDDIQRIFEQQQFEQTRATKSK
jgi:sugar/nucleoside kinase (ribokinase family)